jgi:hypothetical protein
MTAQTPQFLRRKDAGKYLRERFGFSSERALAKLATVGGGPEFHYAGESGRIVVYQVQALDRWAISKIGDAQLNTATFRPKSSIAKNIGRGQ